MNRTIVMVAALIAIPCFATQPTRAIYPSSVYHTLQAVNVPGPTIPAHTTHKEDITHRFPHRANKTTWQIITPVKVQRQAGAPHRECDVCGGWVFRGRPIYRVGDDLSVCSPRCINRLLGE